MARAWKKGDPVVVERSSRPRGSWSRWAGRKGVVLGNNLGEVSVDLVGHGVPVHFMPDELVAQ